MKVFKIHSDTCYYGIAAMTEQEAKECFVENVNDNIEAITSIEEVPESEWDKKDIKIYEDNDPEKESFLVSIRECLTGDTGAFIIFSNDTDLWS